MNETNCNGYIVIGSGMGVKRSTNGNFDFSINLLGLEPDKSHNVYFTQHQTQTKALYEYLKKIFEASNGL